MNRGAAIFLGEDRIVVQSQDRNKDGAYLAGSVARELPHSADVESILIEVELALADSKDEVSTSAVDAKALLGPLLVATGEKTWLAISRAFAYVGVAEDEHGFEFYAGFPEKGAFLFRTEAHWCCDRSDRTGMALGFRRAAVAAIEAQNLANPPLLK
jgi:hypothetical protein